MFRIMSPNRPAAYSVPLDPSVEIMPGMVAQMTVIGNTAMATVSDGTAPFGIIDDIRTKSFTAVSWNEVIIQPVSGVLSSGKIISTVDVMCPLAHPNIIQNSFTSTVKGVLNANNGIITFLAGTELNFDLTGSGTPDSIKAVVNYTYSIPNMPGEDSTMGSGKVTIYYDRFIFQTATFETNCSYVVNASLYCSENGMLTSRRPSTYHPAIGMVTAPPSPIGNSMLECIWY